MLTVTPRTTLPELFSQRVELTPNDAAYRYCADNVWHDVTWSQAARSIARWQQALLREGLQRGDRVALCLHNRIEWMYFDQAALGLGLVVVPLYYNDRPENMAWCLNDAGAKLLLLEDVALWKELQPQLTTVRRAIAIGACTPSESLHALDTWLPQDGEHALVASQAQPQDIATIVYTSGTTGRPKGVMLTQRNIVANLDGVLQAVSPIFKKHAQFLSFLPLSHMLERTIGYYAPIFLNGRVTYARGIPELSEDLVSQKPTMIVSVPRIFERVYAKIDAGLAPGSAKRRLFDKTVDIGWKRFIGAATLGERMLWPLLDLLVARKLRARLGGRLEFIFLGGAALAPHLLKIFTAMGLTFIHGYGLTETSPVISCNRIDDNDPLSVGKAIPGMETRVAAAGELWVRGESVMRGYWNNQAATDAVLDRDGWLHTGDVVEMKNDKIYIRGRVKDIIVLSNGEKIAPGDAEQAILQDTAFEQVLVVGEGRAALGLIAVSAVTDLRELCRRANERLHAFPGYAKIRHVMRAPESWTVDNGLMTPTLKLKRREIELRYARQIDLMYQTRE